MSSKIRWALLALTVAGLALSVGSLWVHYKLITDPTYVSPCNINAQFNCSEVYQSAYGRVAGVPVAFGGVIWFGLAGLMLMLGQPTARTSAVPHYLLGLSIVGLLVVAYLGYASFVALGTGCLLCLGTYLCVLAIAALSKFATSGSVGAILPRLGRDVAALPSNGAGLGAGLMFAVALIWGIANFPAEGALAADAQAPPGPTAIAAEDRANFAAAWAEQPRVDLGVPADGAQVVIVKFNDYACPTCRQAEQVYGPVLARLEQEHPGAIKYAMKDFPINATCNFSVQTIPGHEGACHAAAAARLATDRGAYEQMTAWIWANQRATPEAVVGAATEILGVTEAEFNQAYQSALPAIRQDIADAVALAIEGTPTYYINGVRLPSAIIPVPYFELAIELEMERARTAAADSTPVGSD